MGRKQTEATKQKIRESQKNNWKGKVKLCKVCNKQLRAENKSGYCKEHLHTSEEYKLKLSNSLKGKTGGYRKGSGNTTGGYYKGYYFDSPFEIEVAQRLDELNVTWQRNTKRFYFEFDGKRSYYIPDFLINDFYLETKGYWRDNKKEKTLEAVKQNNLNWKCLMYKDWKRNKIVLENLI